MSFSNFQYHLTYMNTFGYIIDCLSIFSRAAYMICYNRRPKSRSRQHMKKSFTVSTSVGIQISEMVECSNKMDPWHPLQSDV